MSRKLFLKKLKNHIFEINRIFFFSSLLNLLGWHWLTKLYRFQVHIPRYIICTRYCVFTTSQDALFKNFKKLPWLIGLSGLSAGLWTERSLVHFPVRTQAWAAGQVPSWGCARGKRSMYLPHTDVSLPLFSFPALVSKNKQRIFYKKKRKSKIFF